MHLILEKGHSRVPVYYEQATNIIGLVLVNLFFPFEFEILMKNNKFLLLFHDAPFRNFTYMICSFSTTGWNETIVV